MYKQCRINNAVLEVTGYLIHLQITVKLVDHLKILFLGDIVGRPGRKAVQKLLPGMKEEQKIDMVIANGENIAGGFGITPPLMYELFNAGIDVLTSGNHIWNKKEIFQVISAEERLIRPANFPSGIPGRGMGIYKTGNFQVAVINLLGRVFVPLPCDCPFTVALREVENALKITPNIIVDFHAEATSEKLAMGWLLKNKVSAVIGTHTHVQTADERIYPQKAAYITDAGMVGPYYSVLGLDPEKALQKLIYGLPASPDLAPGKVIFNGVLLKLDPYSGKALEFSRVSHFI